MFLYIFEDGECKKSKTGPAPTDLLMIAGGLLQVIECTKSDCYGISEDGTRYDLEDAQVEDDFHS